MQFIFLNAPSVLKSLIMILNVFPLLKIFQIISMLTRSLEIIENFIFSMKSHIKVLLLYRKKNYTRNIFLI